MNSSEVGHTADPMKYDNKDNDPDGYCSTTCSATLPTDAKTYCYANAGTENANSDQFCGYEKDGFVYGARGCCPNPCPGEECPDAKPREPEKYPSSPSIEISHKKKKEVLPRLMIILLIILVILVLTACIFLSVGW